MRHGQRRIGRKTTVVQAVLRRRGRRGERFHTINSCLIMRERQVGVVRSELQKKKVEEEKKKKVLSQE